MVGSAEAGDPSQEAAELLRQVLAQFRDRSPDAQRESIRELQTYLLFVANEQLGANLQAKLGASDVVQQSLAEAVEHISEFRGSTAAEFKGWLRQILINQVRMAHRGFAAEKRDAGRETSLGGSGSGVSAREPADSQLTPASSALADEQAELIRRLIGQLPEEYQTVIRLRNWEELSFEEIATRMSLSTSGAAKTWYRALVEIEQLYRHENESRIRHT